MSERLHYFIPMTMPFKSVCGVGWNGTTNADDGTCKRCKAWITKRDAQYAKKHAKSFRTGCEL